MNPGDEVVGQLLSDVDVVYSPDVNGPFSVRDFLLIVYKSLCIYFSFKGLTQGIAYKTDSEEHKTLGRPEYSRPGSLPLFQNYWSGVGGFYLAWL